MEKKSIVLLAAIAASVIGATGLAFSFGAASKGLVAGTNEPKTHTISFKAGDVTPSAYDENIWGTPFTLHKDDAIEDADGTTYDIESDPYNDETYEGTYFYHGCSATFGGDNLFSFTSDRTELIYIYFTLVKKAELNLSASFISYYVGTKTPENYHNSDTFSLYSEEDPLYNTYRAYASFGSCWNKLIMVDEVKLVFTCPR